MANPNEEEILTTVNILSQDLLVYITHLEEAFNDVEDSEEKTIIQEWLFMILEHLHDDVVEARIRNMALSQMLMDMENNKMRTPFNQRPSCRSYAELIEWLKTMLNQNASLEIGDDDHFDETREPENHEMEVSEFDNLISADNRTYVAISTLPNGGGVFGYIAVTLGDGICTEWLNCRGEPIATPVPFNLQVEHVKTDIKDSKEEFKETNAQQVWNVLKKRGEVCLRNDFYDFYKNLYESVQQEMVAEAEACFPRCPHPFIQKLVEFLVIDLKAIGVTDLKIFNQIKLLSMLKKQIKSVVCEIEKRSDSLETVKKLSTISIMNSLPTKCCYDFISSALWNELHQQRPGSKYLNILSYQYPQYFLPKYFCVLMQQKKKVMNCISGKYCKILDEMFADLDDSIMSNMMKYKDANWEWYVAREVIEAYYKEKDFKDSLCAVEDSVDETTDSFFTVILNEINMAHLKLKSTVKKNNVLTDQLCALRNEILDKERAYNKIVIEFEEQIDTLKLQINVEKRDLMTREMTVTELQRRRKELEEK